MRYRPSRITAGAQPGVEPLRVGTPVYRVRTRWRLARQDRRSALVARRHGTLGVLMSAEQLSDIAGPACRPDGSHETARAALDVLWRTLHRGSARGTAHWNPGVRHLRQAHDVRRWQSAARRHDVTALLVSARRVAADEFDAARAGRRVPPRRAGVAVPSA